MSWPLLLRTVVGSSMVPALQPGTVVLGWRWFRNVRKGNIVIVSHGGLEKIKRIKEVSSDGIYIVGDNPEESTDSRSFGHLPRNSVQAKIIWPITRTSPNSVKSADNNLLGPVAQDPSQD